MTRIEVHTSDLFGGEGLRIQLYVDLTISPRLDVFKEQCTRIPWTLLPQYELWAPQLLRTIHSIDWDDWEARFTCSTPYALIVQEADCTLMLASRRSSFMIPVCCYVLHDGRWLPATASTTGEATINDAALEGHHETLLDSEMHPLSLILTDEEDEQDEKTQDGQPEGITWTDVEPILRNDDVAAFVDLLRSRRHDIDDPIGVERDSLGLCIAQTNAVQCLIGALRLGLEAHVREYTPLFTAAEEGFADMVELLVDVDANLLGEFTFNAETGTSIATWKLLDTLRGMRSRSSGSMDETGLSITDGIFHSLWHRVHDMRGTWWENSAAVTPDEQLELITACDALPDSILQVVGHPQPVRLADRLRVLRALWRKAAILRRDPRAAQLSPADLPVRPNRLEPLVDEATPAPLDDGATVVRVAEFNTILTTKSENELTDAKLQRFPFLVCQWRGMHYFTNYFDDQQRREHARCSHLHRLAPAAAVFFMNGVPMGQSQLIRESGAQHAVDGIRRVWNGLGGNGPQQAYWGEPLQFPSTEAMYQHRMTTNMGAWHDDVQDEKTVALAPVREAGIVGSPTVAMSDLPTHALRYALGLKAYGQLRHHRLRPDYTADGTLAHTQLGKIFVALLTPREMERERMMSVTEAHNAGRIDVEARFVNERETGALGGLSKGCMFLEVVLEVPSLTASSVKRACWMGLRRQQLRQWRAELTQAAQQGEAELQRFGDKMLKRVVTVYQSHLYGQVKAECSRRGCKLVYRTRQRHYAVVPAPLRLQGRRHSRYSREDVEFFQGEELDFV